MHDGDACPQEDVDPFEQPDAISYMNALTQQGTEDQDEEDLMMNLYSIDTNTSGLDNETRELWTNFNSAWNNNDSNQYDSIDNYQQHPTHLYKHMKY